MAKVLAKTPQKMLIKFVLKNAHKTCTRILRPLCSVKTMECNKIDM